MYTIRGEREDSLGNHRTTTDYGDLTPTEGPVGFKNGTDDVTVRIDGLRLVVESNGPYPIGVEEAAQPAFNEGARRTRLDRLGRRLLETESHKVTIIPSRGHERLVVSCQITRGSR